MSNTVGGVKKISELPDLGTYNADAVMPVSFNGETFKLKLSEIRQLVVGQGVVTKSTLGLDRVDNTLDSEKPVSTAQAEEFLKKADKVHTHELSDVNGLTLSLSGIQTDVANLVKALAGKADTAHTHDISAVTNLQAELNSRPSTTTVDEMIATAVASASANNVVMTKVE